jgi:phage repressor protein C with HTH and peptisase S24 domain
MVIQCQYLLVFYQSVNDMDNRAMKTKDEIRKEEAARRGARLDELIRLHFDGKQANFVAAIDANQGEISALAGTPSKSFGSIKARSLENKAGLLQGSLDAPEGSPFYPSEINPRAGHPPSSAKEKDSNNQSDTSPNVHYLQYSVGAKNIRRVFVVGRAQGGLPERLWTDGDYPVGATDEYAEIATTDPHAFLTPVVGTSMVPKFNPGEFVFVEPGTPAEPGDDVLVRLATGETIIKQLVSTRNGIYELHSYNKQEQGPLFFPLAEISWVYYIAHYVQQKKIKTRM